MARIPNVINVCINLCFKECKMNGDQLELNYIEYEIEELERQVEAFKEATNKKVEQLKNRKQLIMHTKINGLDNPNIKGKLCRFWDAYEDGKAVRIMIRPFHSVELGSNGVRFYAQDWHTDTVIGHGWKYCEPLALHHLVGRMSGAQI